MLNISEKIQGFHRFQPAAWLRVTGADALSFLQGQFTQDLVVPGNGSVSYGLWLTQKGRVLADSLIFRLSEKELWILSYGSVGSAIQQRLENYIIADDVTVETAPGEWSGLAVFGQDAGSWLESRLRVPLPEPARFARAGDGFVFRGRRGAEPCFEWMSHELVTLPTSAWVQPVALEVLERTRIAGGVPRVPADIGPGELPNEGGLESAAISYTKGCYLGQETIARLKAMGQVRRMLRRVRGKGQTPLLLPRPLFQKGRRVGELRSAAPDGEGGYVGFGLVTLLGLDSSAGLALAADAEADVDWWSD